MTDLCHVVILSALAMQEWDSDKALSCNILFVCLVLVYVLVGSFIHTTRSSQQNNLE